MVRTGRARSHVAVSGSGPPHTKTLGRNVEPIRSLDEALRAIKSYQGDPEDFQLLIADELLDPAGFHAAVILDAIWARGWNLEGFEQHAGFRTYKVKK